jgi:hypothetical protein
MPPLSLAPMRRLGRGGVRAATLLIAGTLGLAFVINLPHWSRTMAAYGNPLGPSDVVVQHFPWANQPEDIATGLLRAETRMIGRNLMAPLPPLNRAIAGLLNALPGILGPDYGKEMLQGLWNHEDTAGNPVHAALALGALVLVILRPGGKAERVRVYAGAVLGGYFFAVGLLRDASNLVGLRFGSV